VELGVFGAEFCGVHCSQTGCYNAFITKAEGQFLDHLMVGMEILRIR
jgi:hypothetical protein